MCAATGPSFAQRATRHAGVAVSYFFYTRPQIVITLLFFFNATNTSCCICADKSYQRQACAARDPRLARYEMSRKTEPLPFWRRHFPYRENAEHAPVPHKASLPVSGAAAPFLFSRCFALCITHCALFHLPYSFTGFSFYFFVFFRLFLHWIYAFCICNSTYVYIYKQVLSLPVKSSMCPSRLSCSVWCRVILTYIYVHCFRWLVRNHLLS